MPLYYQIQEILRNRIAIGDLKPGDAIPSELELAEQFQVSRMTARQAVAALKHEGLVHSEQGKGTFVSVSSVPKELAKFTSFSEDMRARGLTPSSTVLHFRRESPTPQIADKLRLGPGETVFTLYRLRHADNRAMALEQVYLPAIRFAGLDKHDFGNHSLYDVLAEQYGIIPTFSEQTVQVAELNPYECELLGLTQKNYGLRITRLVLDAGMNVIEHAVCTYHPDRYHLVERLHRDAVRSANPETGE